MSSYQVSWRLWFAVFIPLVLIWVVIAAIVNPPEWMTRAAGAMLAVIAGLSIRIVRWTLLDRRRRNDRD